jgi:hypothetical protein
MSLEVSIYRIRYNYKNAKIELSELNKLFGENYPVPLNLEGSYLDILYCLDKTIDVKGICSRNNIETSYYETFEIPLSEYNNEYYLQTRYVLINNKINSKYYLSKDNF